MLAAALSACSGSSKPVTPAASAATPAAVAAEPSSSPTTTGLPSVASLNPVPLTEGSPAPLPAGIVLYYYGGKVPLEAQPQVLLRAYQSQSGLVVDDLSARIPSGGLPTFNMVNDLAYGRLAVRVCLSGGCDLLGGSAPDARSIAYRSDDGGITWREIGPLPTTSRLVGFVSDGRLVAVMPGPENTAGYFIVDDNSTVTPVPQTSPAWGQPFAWIRREDGALFDISGAILGSPIHCTGSVGGAGLFLMSRRVLDAVAWKPRPSGTDQVEYVSDVSTDGTLARTVSWKGDELDIVGRIDADRLLVIRYYPAPGTIGQAVVLDMASGTLSKISGLRAEPDTDTYPVALLAVPFNKRSTAGWFARVNTGGDCLNARENPSPTSAVRTCLNDGVVVQLLPLPPIDPAPEIVPVQLPDGRPGWVKSEFLER